MSIETVVLAVDDELAILRLMKLDLSLHGFKVITASTGEEALRIAERQRPDIALLDVGLPDMDGIELMKQLRERSSIPVILVTGKDRDEDKVSGLDHGADDYISKPFNPDEVMARLKAVMRRQHPTDAPEGVIQFGQVEVDLGKRLVRRDGKVVNLSRTEWLLLKELASQPGKVMLNKELLAAIWGPEFVDDLQYLRVWVSRLRAKLEADREHPTLIRTLPGIGYVLGLEDAPPVAAEEEAAPTPALVS